MQPYALVVGEALVDVVLGPDEMSVERPGGSAANVAVALSRLGRRVRLASSWADDQRGGLLAEHLTEAGVELATDPHVLLHTSSARAHVGQDGAASYDFDLTWRLGPVTGEGPRFVHVCSLGAVVVPGADDVVSVVQRLRDRATITYDINARPAITGVGPEVLRRVEAVVALAHLVKASDEDLVALYPTRSTEEAAAYLLGLGPGAVAVTRGEAGATWFSTTGSVEVAAPSAQVVDTIGAGDTFAAGLIDALWDDLDRDPVEVLAHAARAAAVTVTRPGADPPYRAELS